MACGEIKHLASLLERLQVLDAKGTSTTRQLTVLALLKQATQVSSAICSALLEIVNDKLATTDAVIPFEVDGFGSEYFMDDANIPSLLSLPTIGFLSSSSAAYVATRIFVLSEKNPYYFSGSEAYGIGGPHIG